jgi:predicted ester cyclase
MNIMLRASKGFLPVFALASILVLPACTQAEAQGESAEVGEMQEQQNKDLLHDYHVTVWEQGHWDQAANYVGPGFTLHSVPVLPNGQTPGPDFFTKWVGAFSDLSSHEDALLAGGDRVSIQWTITATHTGDFFGIPPTNRKIQISGMDVLRVQDGKFAEQWGGVADQMDKVIQQLTSE